MPRPRGIAQAASEPGARPKAKPRPMSWSTNSYHTKSSSPVASAALNASTAGSARPSFIPDSRLSEWRTSRGTRGLVTTLEESTGSVGDSSAPSRNDSVHDRSVSAWATSATSAPVIGIAERELAHRQPPRLLQHLGLDLEPVAEQDHDQRDRGELLDEPGLGVELEHAEAALAEHEPATTKTAVIDRKLRCATPEARAPTISSAPKTSAAASKSVTARAAYAGGPDATTRLQCRSGWTGPVPPRHRRSKATSAADLAIVGGGFTGLWAAVLAKRERPDREIVLLEAETAGWGASGRNGGFVDASLTHGLENGAGRFPRELDALEARAAPTCAELKADLAALDIDAAWESPACCRSRRSRTSSPTSTRRSRCCGATAGPPRRSTARRCAPWSRRRPTSARVLQHTGVGLVDPGALALGLRRAAVALGVRVFERTPVVRASAPS